MCSRSRDTTDVISIMRHIMKKSRERNIDIHIYTSVFTILLSMCVLSNSKNKKEGAGIQCVPQKNDTEKKD